MKKGFWTGSGASDPLSKKECIALGIPYKWWKPIQYIYHTDPATPLTYHAVNGLMYRPLNNTIHNMGSIPRILCLMPCFDKDRYADGYTLHDCGYKKPHQILASTTGSTFVPIFVTQVFMDNLLEESIVASGGWKITSLSITHTVRLFGVYSWKTNKL